MKYFASKISENMARTPEGFLLCIGCSIGRTGSMDYAEGEVPVEPGPDGKITITRSAKEVFKIESMSSYEGKDFVVLHPEDFVDSENWNELSKGHIQNIRRGDGEQGNDLVADLLIKDADTISLVEGGMRGLSCGYEAEYIQTGVGTAEQVNIVGNHLALVDEGRAGESYQIKDSKGVFSMKTKLAALKDKIMNLGKTVDALTKDAEPPKEKVEEKTDDAAAYDDLVKMVDALGEKVSGMKPAAKDAVPPKKDEPAPKEDKAEDEEGGSGMEERMKALEAAVAKILSKMSGEAGDEDMDEEETGDDDMEETDDDEMEEVVGDTKDAVRAEILCPGIKITKDVKAKALKQFAATEDGAKVLKSVLGGKKLTFDSADKVDMIFNSASDIMRVRRAAGFGGTKVVSEKTRKKTNDEFQSHIFNDESVMTAEKMNELNEKLYASASK